MTPDTLGTCGSFEERKVGGERFGPIIETNNFLSLLTDTIFSMDAKKQKHALL